MDFRTSFLYAEMPNKIALNDKIISLGSCFAVEIGEKLAENKFDISINPLGTIFNSSALKTILSPFKTWENDIVERDNLFFSLFAGANIYAEKREDLVQNLAEISTKTINFAQNADVVMLTLGTAYCYRLKNNGKIVANCHKLPQNLFEKILQTPEEVENDLAEIVKQIESKKIILTLSPVRHTKDTLPLNSVSKAVLRLAIHQICQKFPQVYYFPAYEWITDDLRDYRFFKADMIHPNEQAIAYIWEKFLTYCIDDNSQNFIQKCSKINLMLAHKPLQTNSLGYEKFLNKLEEQIKEINQIKPVFDFKNG